jgi:hypothetical protein
VGSGNVVSGPSGGEASRDDLDDTEQKMSEGGSWGPSGRNGHSLEPEEAEAWDKEAARWRIEAKEMHANDTSSGCHKGLVYEQLHGLTHDADWWKHRISASSSVC